MNAMERLRRRLETLLDTRTQAGQIRQKRLAEYMGKSEAWLSNILAGKKGRAVGRP
jgi:transcriptional regulator with XRE-family HTH domain